MGVSITAASEHGDGDPARVNAYPLDERLLVQQETERFVRAIVCGIPGCEVF
jgi:hypothetical protein